MNEKEVQKLIERLEAIAEKNNDRFDFRIEIFSCGVPHDKKWVYNFLCQRRLDHHTFVSGSGNNLQDAVSRTSENIKEALYQWEYKE